MKTNNNKVHVKRDDMVIVMSGNDKGKKGKVVEVSPSEGKIIVQGANIVSKHVKPRKQGEVGGIVKVEGPMYACKVQLLCPKCDKPTRAKHRINAGAVKSPKDKKTRVCAKCGAEL